MRWTIGARKTSWSTSPTTKPPPASWPHAAAGARRWCPVDSRTGRGRTASCRGSGILLRDAPAAIFKACTRIGSLVSVKVSLSTAITVGKHHTSNSAKRLPYRNHPSTSNNMSTKIPWVNGPNTPETDGENHRTVNIRHGRQSLSIRCPSQKEAFRLKGRLISAFQGLTDNTAQESP